MNNGLNMNKIDDTISRQAVLDVLNNIEIPRNASWYQYYQQALTAVDKLPPAQLGTNLAEVGTDTISRRELQDKFEQWQKTEDYSNDEWNLLVDVLSVIKSMPPAQPERKLQKLAEEIAAVKRRIKSENSDYLTGYLSALSAVEGMIVDMREETT